MQVLFIHLSLGGHRGHLLILAAVSKAAMHKDSSIVTFYIFTMMPKETTEIKYTQTNTY